MAEIDIQKRKAPMWPWIFGIAIAVILIILLVTTRDGTDVASPYGAGPDFPERPQPVIPPAQPQENRGVDQQPDEEGIAPEQQREEQPGTAPTLQPGVQPDPSPQGPRGGGPFDGPDDPMHERWMEEQAGFSDEELYGSEIEDDEGYEEDEHAESHYAPESDEQPLEQEVLQEQGVQRASSNQGSTDLVPPLMEDSFAGAQVFGTEFLEAEVFEAEVFDDEGQFEAVEPVEDFARFVEGSSQDLDLAAEHVYAATGAQYLAAALASLAVPYPVSSVDPVERRAQIDEQADLLDDEELVEDHARVVRNVFADAARWLRTIQGEYFPELEGDLDGVDEAVAAIDGEGNLLDQAEHVDTFFVRVSDVLHRMQGQGAETHRY